MSPQIIPRYLLYKWPLNVASITLDISEICNQICLFCDRRIKFIKSRNKPRYWSFSDFVKASKVFGVYRFVTFAGGCGEPLMNPYIVDMLKYLKDKFPMVKVRILTNGVTLKPKLFDEIKNYVDIFRFSVNSFNKDVYKEIILGGSYEKMINNISYAYRNKNKGQKFIISYIGMKCNIRDFPDLILFSNEIGIDEVHLQSLSERGDKKIKGQSLVRYPNLLISIWKYS